MSATAPAVRRIVGQQLGFVPESLFSDDTLAGLDASDADRIDISFKIEDEFEIHVSDEQREAWRTVGDVLATTERLLAACD